MNIRQPFANTPSPSLNSQRRQPVPAMKIRLPQRPAYKPGLGWNEGFNQFDFSGTDIPRVEPDVADLKYFVQGGETEDHIASLTWASHDAVVDLHFSLLGYDCDENSLLTVLLWEQ